MASYLGESNIKQTGLRPAKSMPRSGDRAQQPDPQVSSAHLQGQQNPYMNKHRKPQQPAYEAEPTLGTHEQPAPKVGPTFRTSAVHDGSALEEYHRGQEEHYRRKAQPKQQAGHNTDPSLGGNQYQSIPTVTDSGYSKFPTAPPISGTSRPQMQSTTPPLAPAKQSPDALAAANEKASRRKPVPESDPKIGQPAPPHKHTISADELGLKACVSPPEPVAAGAQQYIGLRDGKFDTRRIHPGASARTDMPKSPYEAVRPPSRGRTADVPMPKSRLDTSPDRNAKPGINRRDSSSSMHSISDGIKRLGSRVRRGSAEFFENVGKAASLASKHPIDRKKHENAKIKEKRDSARERSEEREKLHQAHPQLRPAYEQTALWQKNQEGFDQQQEEGRRDLDARSPFDPNQSRVMSHSQFMAQAQEQNSLYRKAEAAQWAVHAALRVANQTQGDKSQPSPGAASFELDMTLSPTERGAIREANSIPTRDQSPPLDKWDQRGTAMGKVLDPFRRKRSDESDFMSGENPEGSMDPCSRCKQEPQSGALKQGLCEPCREAMKHEKRHK